MTDPPLIRQAVATNGNGGAHGGSELSNGIGNGHHRPAAARFTESGCTYLLRHAIDPELAAELGVREERGALVYPCGDFERRRPLTGDRTIQPTGVPLCLWWPAGRPASGAEVLLCEGEPDGLAALTSLAAWTGDVPVERPVVGALPGTGTPVATVVDELRGAGAVTLAMDGDAPGRKCQARLAEALREAGITVGTLDLPDGKDLADLLVASEDPGPTLAGLLADSQPTSEDPSGGPAVDLRVVTLEEFVAVEEDGAEPVVGEGGRILIPEGGDIMFFGDGGAGKTTLTIDLACHLGAGADWLGIPVPQPRRVLLIESEGPRPFFRQKLGRKLEAWQGPALAGRVLIFEHPWGCVSFAEEEWRAKLAELVREGNVDVLIAGPLTRLGMDVAGTLQEVRAFMDLVADVRRRSERPLTVALVHHENKGGAVSGAWEGAGDTLFHVQAAGNGHTVVVVQKARWDSERHGKTMHLAWAEGDGFRLEGDRDYLAELEALLADGEWRTAKQMSAPEDEGGIGAGEKAIKATLDQNPERFEARTGEDAKALGRHPSATVWQVRSGSNAPDAPSAFSGGAEDAAAPRPSLKGAAADEHTPGDSPAGAFEASAQSTQTDLDEWAGRLVERNGDLV